jgi:hypothetical protein
MNDQPNNTNILTMYRKFAQARGYADPIKGPIVSTALGDLWDAAQAFALRDAAAIALRDGNLDMRRELLRMIPQAHRDSCVRCSGLRGGVPGNENMENGYPVCDYCSAYCSAR